MSRVPAAAPTRLAPEEATAVRAAIESVLVHGPWVLGHPVERFEEEYAAFVGAPSAVGVGNGTDALVIALAALDLPPGSAVLVAAVEGGYAATAARLLGLEPRVMDVNRLTMGPTVAHAEAAARAAGQAVSAIVVTHLHGDAVPLDGPDGLDAWRRTRGLPLVEDCAQAHGLRPGGRPVGAVGDAATYSFYPTKNLGAVGDGGLVTFTDPGLAARGRRLRQYGWGERYRVDLPGGRNSRLDALQAAVLSARLPFLDARNDRRRAIAGRYRAALTDGTRLHGDPATTVAHHAVLVTEGRDGVRRALDEAGIDTAVHYPFLLGEMTGLATAPAPTPESAWLRDRILSLPCFPELRNDEVGRVVAALADLTDPRNLRDTAAGGVRE